MPSVASSRLHLLAALAGVGTVEVTVAQIAPPPQYELKEADPAIGSHIKRQQVRGSSVALNLPYHQLPEADRRRLHSWTKFKPAVCAGQPCRMEFPLNTNFVLRP
jgi:hypothetical protein